MDALIMQHVFCTRVKNDKTATMSLKLTSSISIREIEIDTDA